MSQTLALIQNKIDSSKELIGDGEYLELCNLMKQLYQEKRVAGHCLSLQHLTTDADNGK